MLGLPLACLALLAAPAADCARAADARLPRPSVSAAAALVIEAGSGHVLYSLREHERRAIASTTKLMTAYVALQHATPGHRLTVQPFTPIDEETIAGLRAGQVLDVKDLLKALLLPSGADAANTLAVDLGGSTARYVRWMNAAARSLDLDDTHYSTPIGLDAYGNYSTASDLARLTQAALRNPVIAGIVDLASARLTDGQVVYNRNDLVGRFGWVVGVKTGHTASAGFCLIGAARLHRASVISVALGDPSEATRDADTLALLRYGLARAAPRAATGAAEAMLQAAQTVLVAARAMLT